MRDGRRIDPDEVLRLVRERYDDYLALCDSAEDVEKAGGLTAVADLHEEAAEMAIDAAGHAVELIDWLASGGAAPDWGIWK